MHLLGNAVRANGYVVNQAGLYIVPDLVNGLILLDTGGQASFTWAFNACQLHDQTDIIGGKGWIRFPTFEDVPVFLENESGQEVFNIPTSIHIQKPLIQAVMDELQC